MTAPSSVSRDYHGSRAWADAWAAKLQSRIGVITIPYGQEIVAVKARPYGTSRKVWSVVEEWRYVGYPSLGVFGTENYLLLPERMP